MSVSAPLPRDRAGTRVGTSDPPDPTMHLAPPPETDAVQRWRRLQMQVRCGLYPDQPARIRRFLLAGARLVRLGLLAPAAVQLQTVRTLVQVGEDTALPWFWRSVCLEHVNLPLARLRSLIGGQDPQTLRTLELSVQRARDRLPAGPGAASPMG